MKFQRLAGLRIRARNAVMPRHRQFEAAAKCSSMQSHDDGFGAIFNLFQEIVQIGSARAAAVRVFLCTRPTDMRKSFEGPS